MRGEIAAGKETLRNVAAKWGREFSMRKVKGGKMGRREGEVGERKTKRMRRKRR